MRLPAVLCLLAAGGARAAPADWTAVNAFLAEATLSDASTSAPVDPQTAPYGTVLVTVADTVDDLVSAGTLTIGNVSCGSAVVSGALGVSSTTPSASIVRAAVTLADIAFECAGTLTWTGVSIPSLAVVGNSGSAVFRETSTAAALGVAGEFTLGAGRLLGYPDRPVSFAVDESACAVTTDVAGDTLLETGGPGDPTFSLILRTVAHEMLSRLALCNGLASALDTELTSGIASLNAELDDVADDTPADSVEQAAAEAAMVASLTAQQLGDAVRFSNSGAAGVVLAVARQLLGVPGNGTGGEEPGINGLVRRVTDTSDGTVSLDLSGLPDFGEGALAGGSVSFGSNVTLSGLATFAALDALRPVAGLEYSLASSSEVDELRVSAPVLVDAVTASATSGDGRLTAGAVPLVVRASSLQLLARNVTSNATQAVAFNSDEISDVQLGQLRDAPLACGAPAVYKLNLSSLELQPVASQVELLVGGFEDAGLDAAAAGLSALLNLLYAPSLTADLVPIARGVAPLLTDVLNQVAEDEAAAACPAFVPDFALGALLDFDDADARAVQSAIADTLAVVDDPATGINQVMREISAANGLPLGVFETNNTESLSITFEADADSALEIRVLKLRFENTDSFRAFQLLAPVGSSPTRRAVSEFVFGKDLRPLIVELDMEIVGTGALDMLDTPKLRFAIDNFTLGGDADLFVLRAGALALTLDDVLGVTCLATALDLEGPDSGVGVRDVTADSDALDLDCSTCGLTPQEEADTAETIRTNVAVALAFFEERANRGDARVAVNDFFRELALDCRGRVPSAPPTRDPDVGLNTVYLTNAGVWGMAAGAAAALLAGGCVRRRRQHAGVAPRKTEFEEQRVGRRAAAPEARALMMHAATPVWTRVAVLALVLLAFGLFASANNADMGRVQAVITTSEGREVRLDDIFTLSLTGTIADLFATDLAALGVVTAVMTASWPYLRLFLLLVCFTAPPAAIGETARGRALTGLDFFGKWIVVDQLLILVLAVALDIRLDPPKLDGIAPDGTGLRTRIQLGWGLYGFLLGAVAAAAASNIVLSRHRAAVSPPALARAGPGGARGRAERSAMRAERMREPLRAHLFQPLRGDGARMQLRIGALSTVSVVASTVSCIGLIFAAAFLDLVTFDYKGAGGIALLGLSDGAETVTLSIASFAQKLGGQATTAGETPGVAVSQIFVLLTVLAVPLAQQVLLLVAYFAKLTLREQRALWALQDSLRVWALLEVFAIAVAASVQNVGAFVTFATASLCRDLNRIIRTYVVPFGLLPAEEGTCFTVFGSLSVGFYVALLAGVLGLCNAYAMNSIARLAIEEREEIVFAATTQDIARARTAAVHVYEAPRSLGLFHWIVTRHLRKLSRFGFVRVRMAPRTLHDGEDAQAEQEQSAKVAVYGGGGPVAPPPSLGPQGFDVSPRVSL